MASLQKVDIAHLQAFHAFSDEISAIVVDGRNFHLDNTKRFYKKVTARKIVSVLISSRLLMVTVHMLNYPSKIRSYWPNILLVKETISKMKRETVSSLEGRRE